MSKSESVCLVGGEEIPEHQRMYVFRTDSPTTPTRVPGRVCVEHGGNGRNQFAPARYYAMVARAVVAEYDRIVMGNRSEDWDARREVAFASNGADISEVMGEALDVAESMGYTYKDEDDRNAFYDALSPALTRLRVYYRAFYPRRQQASLAELMEAFHAWHAQRVALIERENADSLRDVSADEWHQSDDDGTELLADLAGELDKGECRHERMTYDSVSEQVQCDDCPQYWPTWEIIND